MNRGGQDRRISWPFWAFIIVIICLIYQELFGVVENNRIEDNLHMWLKSNGLSFVVETLNKDGVTSFDKLLQLDVSYFVEHNRLSNEKRNVFITKLNELRTKNVKLKEWLKSKGLEKYISGFYRLGYIDLESVQTKMLRFDIKDIITTVGGSFTDYQLLIQAVEELKDGTNRWIIISIFYIFFRVATFLFKWLLRLLLLVLGYFSYHIAVYRYNQLRPRNMSFFHYLIGFYLDPKSCRVEWLQNDNIEVGNIASFQIKLQYNNRILFYKITGKEKMRVEIRNKEGAEQFVKELDKRKSNTYCVTFHPKISGRYTISVLIDGKHICDSPFVKTFTPGPVDMSKVSIMNGINTIVVSKGVYYPLKIETKDKYENICELDIKEDIFEINVKQVGLNGSIVDAEPVILPESNGGKNMLHIKLEDEGCFHAVVTYQGRIITNGVFDIVSLNYSNTELLEKATTKDSWHQTWYEGYLLPGSSYPNESGDDLETFLKTCRKIYFYFSSRQFIIKEFYFKIIPYRLYTFRISPSTKIKFPDNSPDDVFLLEDGIQPPVAFLSTKRNLVVATFARFLLRNIGGAESFKDKKNFFYKALQAHNVKNKTLGRNVTLEIDRRNILDSSYEATKSFSTSKWCRRFIIKFQGEPGQDVGGLTREWISILSTALFDPKNELFTQFNKEDKQALIYPNPSRPSRLKLKYYEFAGRIVGKCIFESSCSSIRRLNVKARFMRSFLAQLIGLRVNYQYFKTDDKQLYTSKIKYIQDVDPEDLNLCFCEDEYDNNGKLRKEVDLIPNGSKIEVTKENKMKYLDALAQYKLHTRVSTEIEAFVKGLNELVPDNLLTMFSEQELELLICGTSDISVNDLKNNHNAFEYHSTFSKVMSWFWKSASLFNQEELARLLQFTTGSSQLPPGGFSCLTPKFSFSSSSLKNVLPVAHTCFNQLVLPDYSSYEEFHRCLHLAITEGCEGFGFE